MLFNSLEFVFFLPLVVLGYSCLPPKARLLLLLSASYYFYMCWKIEYIFLILTSTLVDYVAGIQIEKHQLPAKKKAYLYLSLFINLGLLFFFKYFNFFSENVNFVFNKFNLFHNLPYFNIALPIGISFYTFQTLSYTIDIYRGKAKAEKDPIVFALYVSFFPQLVAGPIERATRLVPQLKKLNKITFSNFCEGSQLMLWGFFKKLVIADRLADYVNKVYNNPHSSYGVPIIVATYFFAYQVYCDFSGYTDIARGTAKIFGIDLTINFNRPYFSKTFTEIFKRWHMSLTTWIYEYLFSPLLLATRGWGRLGLFFSLGVTFFLSGLWHGAAWNMVMWGVVAATLLCLDELLKKPRKWLSKKMPLFAFNGLSIFITFHLWCFAIMFFRVNTIGHVPVLFRNFFSLEKFVFGINITMGVYEIMIGVIAIIILETVHVLQENKWVSFEWKDYSFWSKASMAYALLLAILLFGQFNLTEFIYFQF
ncbi:MBOAT family O-acyltransferase [Fibrobacterota bacterium]